MPKGHIVTYMKRSEFDHTAKCQCGWNPDVRRKLTTKQMVEDEVAKHKAEMDRVALLLKPKRTSLEAERDHALEMSKAEHVPENERATWRILYDDLAKRCGREPTPEEQPELPLGL